MRNPLKSILYSKVPLFHTSALTAVIEKKTNIVSNKKRVSLKGGLEQYSWSCSYSRTYDYYMSDITFAHTDLSKET